MILLFREFQSIIIQIRIETPDKAQRLITSCFLATEPPNWFLYPKKNSVNRIFERRLEQSLIFMPSTNPRKTPNTK